MLTTSNRTAIPTALALATALLLSGCGGSGTSDASDGSSADSATSSKTSQAAELSSSNFRCPSVAVVSQAFGAELVDRSDQVFDPDRCLYQQDSTDPNQITVAANVSIAFVDGSSPDTDMDATAAEGNSVPQPIEDIGGATAHQLTSDDEGTCEIWLDLTDGEVMIFAGRADSKTDACPDLTAVAQATIES